MSTAVTASVRDEERRIASPALPLRYLYILGAGHSGSTLLAMVLGSHPRLCTIGEVKALTTTNGEYQCSCGERVANCDFWRAVARELGGDGSTTCVALAADIRDAPNAYLRVLLQPLHRGRIVERARDAALAVAPGWRRHLRRIRRSNATLARAVCAVSRKDVFVDSSKTGLQLKYLLRNPALDVKVLRLVRDGRGVSLSYRTADRISLADAAYRWRRSNEEAEAIVADLPRGRWLDVRYEEFCAEPGRVLHSIHQLVGVDDPDRPTLQPGGSQHVLGNDRMRMQAKAIRLDERWRRTLSQADLKVFDEIGGAMNRRLGYQS